MATKKADKVAAITDEPAPDKKADKVQQVLNEDGTPAITDEERQASIDTHQRMLDAHAGVERP